MCFSKVLLVLYLFLILCLLFYCVARAALFYLAYLTRVPVKLPCIPPCSLALPRNRFPCRTVPLQCCEPRSTLSPLLKDPPTTFTVPPDAFCRTGLLSSSGMWISWVLWIFVESLQGAPITSWGTMFIYAFWRPTLLARSHLASKLRICLQGGVHIPCSRNDSSMRAVTNSISAESLDSVPTNTWGTVSSKRWYCSVGRTICNSSRRSGSTTIKGLGSSSLTPEAKTCAHMQPCQKSSDFVSESAANRHQF
mmetsp:Transcript_14211/g.24058  ORF Transcript_14211/g.24058 Transcript_14211/m.24058 type:complete len:251 (+) Transcript_14211:93-845(+)